MRHTRVLLLLACLLAALRLCAPAAHSLVIPMDLADLTRAAQRVVVARVEDVRAAQDRPGRAIYTFVRLTVEETLAGPRGPQRLMLRVPGGRIGNLRYVVSEVPTFSVGERCVLFLAPGRCPLAGAWQGKKTIVDNRVLGENMSLGRLRQDVRNYALGVPALRSGGEDFATQPASAVVPPDVRSAGVSARGTTTILDDDFEGAFPGSWSRSGSPTWGTTTYYSRSATHSVFCAGSSITPPSNYAANMNAWMIYGPFDLSDATSAELNFYLRNQSELNTDYVWWMSSADGTSFSGQQHSGTLASFTLYTLDLASRLGDGSVWIAFVFTSNATNQYQGAFIDDVVLTKEVPGADAPVITSITPDHAFAGTGYSVTIDGSNFGSTRGTSKVEFFQRSGQPKLEAASYSSWSDTQIVCTVPEDASSGPVTVWTSAGGTSGNYDLDITFGYGGIYWYAADIPLDFYVNPNTSDCTGEETAVSSAATTWNNNDGGSSFSFNYLGTTSLTVGDTSDGNNVCWWATDLPDGTAAWNSYWISGGQPDRMVEFDIEFNDTYYTWSTASSTPGTEMDVETTALHELGHCFNLSDQYGTADSAEAMYGLISKGQQKRSVDDADTVGVYYIYAPPALVRLANVQALARGLGTLLRFSYLDPRPLAEFRVYRRSGRGGLVKLGSLPYSGSGADYEFLDQRAPADPTQYRIGAVDFDGRVELLDLFPLPPR